MFKYLFILFLLFSACGAPETKSPSEEADKIQKQARLDSLDEVMKENDLQRGKTGHCTNPPGVPERKDVKWNPSALLTKAEKAICGTWVATLGDPAISAGGVGIMMDPNSGKKGIDAIADAVEKNRRMDQSCAWLEFYDDHSGFWNSCMLNNGSPAAMDNVDPFTGEHSGSGVKFEWYLEGKSIRIKFEDCLKFPIEVKDKGTLTARVQYWNLQIVKYGPEKDGMNTCTTRDYLPEYDYTSPVKYEYSFSSKLLNGKVGKYKSCIMD